MTTLTGMGRRALANIPALADLSDRVLFGEVWAREGLSKRDRSLVTVACLVALNVPGNELALLVGDHTLTWQPRPNRALLLDRHDQRQQLFVPFVRPGRLASD